MTKDEFVKINSRNYGEYSRKIGKLLDRVYEENIKPLEGTKVCIGCWLGDYDPTKDKK